MVPHRAQLCIVIAALCAAPMARAAEEIIVTARKRVERLQDVPVSVGVLNASEIRESGARDISDVALRTSGFSFAPLLGGVSSTPVIRGMSTTIGESNVGFFTDGVYQSSRTAMSAPLAYDIDRVEILRGAQNAFYGRNTFAGAVNFVTSRPAHTFEARAEATFGSYDQRELKLDLSGPVAPGLYARATGLTFSRSGFFANALTHTDLDPRKTNLVTMSLAAEPNADIRVYGRIAYEDTHNGDDPLRFLPNNAAPFDPTSRGQPPAFQIYKGVLPAPEGSFAVTPGGFDRGNLLSSITVEAGRLTSITGYNNLGIRQRVDNDFEAESIRFLHRSIDEREVSQEIRLTSPPKGRLYWMIGGYFYHFDGLTQSEDRYVGEAAQLPPVYQALSGLPSLDNSTKETTESYALFGQSTVDLAPHLRATLAVRWATEQKAVRSQDMDPLSGSSATFADTKNFYSLVPVATLALTPREGLMLYASASRGTKSGGFNVTTTAGAVLPSERTYRPESSWNYEVGVKASLWGGKAEISGAAYLIKWNDQIVRALGRNYALINANAGRSTTWGTELELTAQPVDAVRVSAGISYTDARYDRYTFGALASLGIDPTIDGKELQYVSKYAGWASVRVGTTYFGQLDMSYRSAQSAVQTADALLGDSVRLSLRAGVVIGRAEIVAWVRNLTNDAASASGTFIPSPAARYDFARGLSGAGPNVGLEAFNAVIGAPDPRTFGITLRLSL